MQHQSYHHNKYNKKEKDYQNIIVFVFDAMGEDIINKMSNSMKIYLDKENNDNIGYGRELDMGLITTEDSNVSVWVIPTNEEIMIVRDSYKIISRTNWSKLWEDKVDYFEYQMGHLIKKYPILYNTIDYYLGISENKEEFSGEQTDVVDINTKAP